MDIVKNEATAKTLSANLKKLLSGECRFIDQAATIIDLCGDLNWLDSMNDVLRDFILILSETDHLPKSSTQHLWAIESLQKLKAEIDQSENWAFETASNSAKILLERCEQYLDGLRC